MLRKLRCWLGRHYSEIDIYEVTPGGVGFYRLRCRHCHKNLETPA